MSGGSNVSRIRACQEQHANDANDDEAQKMHVIESHNNNEDVINLVVIEH